VNIVAVMLLTPRIDGGIRRYTGGKLAEDLVNH
jgi:hypothetical protein